MSPEIRERLAEYAHEAWSGWMRYLFEHSTLNTDGTVTIPAWAADRWRRQAGTLYEDLSDVEQDSDRKEADRMLAIMLADPPPAPGSETPDWRSTKGPLTARWRPVAHRATEDEDFDHHDKLLDAGNELAVRLEEAQQRFVTLTDVLAACDLQQASDEKLIRTMEGRLQQLEAENADDQQRIIAFVRENQALRERADAAEAAVTALSAALQTCRDETAALRKRERAAFEAGFHASNTEGVGMVLPAGWHIGGVHVLSVGRLPSPLPVLHTRGADMKTCEDCGERVYELGGVNCNEADYIETQNEYDDGDIYTAPDLLPERDMISEDPHR